MIITLIIVAILIVSFILFILSDRISDYYLSEDISMLGGVGIALFGVVFICCLIVICGAHIGVDNRIEMNRIEYESLLQRQKMIDSDYEDISKSDVIRDIAGWNSAVQSTRYWAYSPWTNWFYSKQEVDELKFIEYP